MMARFDAAAGSGRKLAGSNDQMPGVRRILRPGRSTIRREVRTNDTLGSDRLRIAGGQVNQVIASAVAYLNS